MRIKVNRKAHCMGHLKRGQVMVLGVSMLMDEPVMILSTHRICHRPSNHRNCKTCEECISIKMYQYMLSMKYQHHSQFLDLDLSIIIYLLICYIYIYIRCEKMLCWWATIDTSTSSIRRIKSREWDPESLASTAPHACISSMQVTLVAGRLRAGKVIYSWKVWSHEQFKHQTVNLRSRILPRFTFRPDIYNILEQRLYSYPYVDHHYMY